MGNLGDNLRTLNHRFLSILPDSLRPNSTMSDPNSESSNSHSQTTTIPSSPSTENPSVSSIENPNPVVVDPEIPNDGSSNSVEERVGAEGEAGEEEEGECGFCLFMKAGGCKETFVSWETCVEEAEKSGEDIAMKCMEATSALKRCMEAHADYYEPILKAEKAAEEEAIQELEKEKAAKDSEQNLEPKQESEKAKAAKDSEQNLEAKEDLQKN